MSEQRDDCDRFCMAPHGNHHWRCPATAAEMDEYWSLLGKAENEQATPDQLVQYFRGAPTHLAYSLANSILWVLSNATDAIAGSIARLELESGRCEVCGYEVVRLGSTPWQHARRDLDTHEAVPR